MSIYHILNNESIFIKYVSYLAFPLQYFEHMATKRNSAQREECEWPAHFFSYWDVHLRRFGGWFLTISTLSKIYICLTFVHFKNLKISDGISWIIPFYIVHNCIKLLLLFNVTQTLHEPSINSLAAFSVFIDEICCSLIFGILLSTFLL